MLYLAVLTVFLLSWNLCSCDFNGTAKGDKNYIITNTGKTQQTGAVSFDSESRQPISESQAVAIAQSFLKEQSFANEYDIETATATDIGDYWRVWFETKQRERKPNKGLVEVDMITGNPMWKRLR